LGGEKHAAMQTLDELPHQRREAGVFVDEAFVALEDFRVEVRRRELGLACSGVEERA